MKYKITHTDAGKTIDTFLREHGYSKNLIVHLKNTELGISIDNDLKYITYILREGEELVIKIVENAPNENIIPVNMPLDIVYEDDDLLIINKPFGMPIHPSMHNFDNTLANALCYYFTQKNEDFTYRVINRLDRDTTGLLIVAKNMLSAGILSTMVREHRIHRKYITIVDGVTDESGIIEAPIARVNDSVIARCVDTEHGDYAKTRYKKILSTDSHSLLLVKLYTGRTHQIRVHMRHIGHPVIGDFLYNPDYSKISRQALHSYMLEFDHPITNRPLSFTTSLPDDFKSVLNISSISIDTSMEG